MNQVTYLVQTRRTNGGSYKTKGRFDEFELDDCYDFYDSIKLNAGGLKRVVRQEVLNRRVVPRDVAIHQEEVSEQYVQGSADADQGNKTTR